MLTERISIDPSQKKERTKPFEAVVVLGKNWDQQRIKTGNSNQAYREEPEFALSRDSILSATAAAELYLQGRTERIIFSTGQTLEEMPSESQAMHDHLRRFYSHEEIPDEAITLEDTSIDTAGNAEHTIPLIKDYNAQDVAILTVGYHTRRAKKLFKKIGVGIPDKNVLSSEETLGIEGNDPQRSLAKRIRETAVEAGLTGLLYVDPKGEKLREITTRIRK